MENMRYEYEATGGHAIKKINCRITDILQTKT